MAPLFVGDRARGVATCLVALLLAGLYLSLGPWQAPAKAAAASEKAELERRVALVIGNGAYRAVPQLKNPVNDARAMAATLRELGFKVIEVEDADLKTMQKAFVEFSQAIPREGTALFYFAGHGMQLKGLNYLVPVDATIDTAAAIPFETFPLEVVTDQLNDAHARIALVILDACRNSPFGRGLRGLSGGLAAIDAASGTLIAYATAPGAEAEDGDSDHGLYTSELLSAIKSPGLDVEQVFKKVRAAVSERSGEKQVPWESSSLIGDFFFVPASSPAAATAASNAASTGASSDRDIVFWTSVKDSGDPALLQAYLDQFPQGTFAGAAKIMVEKLRRGLSTAELAKTAPAPGPGATPQQQASALPPAAAVRAPSAGAAKYPVGIGQSFRDCADCPEMVVIPPGEYQMGSSPADTSREGVPEENAKRERPMHPVRVAQALAVGKFHVTRGQFARFVEASGYSGTGGCRAWNGSTFAQDSTKSWRDPGFPQTDRDPVVCVSWYDATAYVQWLAHMTGRGYRLLTEAEWEYAARGGTSTARWWGEGSADQCKYAHGGNLTTKQVFPGWTTADCRDGYVFTSPAGSFAPNPFGLYDMLGEAWQWVEDCWASDYAGAPSDSSIALLSGDCRNRASRGGSWSAIPTVMRVPVRSWNDAGYRGSNLGFRVARSPSG